MSRPDLEFDDVIYHLQRNRGASVYWQQLGVAVAAERPDWTITHRAGSRRARLAPVPSTAKVFHSSLFRVGLGRGVANVVTIHDLAYEKGLVPGRRAKVGLAQRRLAVRAADGLVFISETTRREFAACYPQAAGVASIVAWHGRDESWDAPLAAPPTLPDGLVSGRFLLHVGHRAGYKNFGLALAGYAQSAAPSDGRPLVVLGPPLDDDERRLLAHRGLTGSVRWYDAPDRGTLRAFMTAARALLYVSREEGFGMPLVESMQCGVPVIAADASCLPEIGGGAAVLVDPDDPAAVAAAVDALADDSWRATIVERGLARARDFTWQSSAAAHVELYTTLGAGTPDRGSP